MYKASRRVSCSTSAGCFLQSDTNQSSWAGWGSGSTLSEAARIAGLNVLCAARKDLGALDKVTKVIKLAVYLATEGEFFAQPKVVDAASELLRDVFGADKLPLRILRTTFGALLNAAEMGELIRKNVVKKTRLPRRIHSKEPPLVSLDDLKSLLKELPQPSRSIATPLHKQPCLPRTAPCCPVSPKGLRCERPYYEQSVLPLEHLMKQLAATSFSITSQSCGMVVFRC
jgi:hypothetical protein